jgi:predicted MFS family arabinose efflux permease
MIMPMATALLGAHVPRERRSQALGWYIAGPMAMMILGVPLVNYIGDWRQSFLFFALPFYLIALLLSFFGIPSLKRSNPKTDILSGYRGIFSSKSALACLVSIMLGQGFWMIPITLFASYFRSYYAIPRGMIVYISMVYPIVAICGSLISGRFISRVGLKKATVLSVIGLGIFTIAMFAGLPKVLAIVFGFFMSLMAGFYQPSFNGLSLGQLPELRGSMMSMQSAFTKIGAVIFVSLSGLLLIQYDWRVMIMITGVFSFISGLIVFLYAKEPSRE